MLSDLRAEKKKILDDVMEKETYKVAKEILEKFAPDQLKKDVRLQINLYFGVLHVISSNITVHLCIMRQ